MLVPPEAVCPGTAAAQDPAAFPAFRVGQDPLHRVGITTRSCPKTTIKPWFLRQNQGLTAVFDGPAVVLGGVAYGFAYCFLGWRDAIELAAAHEELLLDGVPVADGRHLGRRERWRCECDAGGGRFGDGDRVFDGATAPTDCIHCQDEPRWQQLEAVRCAYPPVCGCLGCWIRQRWQSESEAGTWLAFSAATPCH